VLPAIESQSEGGDCGIESKEGDQVYETEVSFPVTPERLAMV
jgi:hypothetical protein